MSKNKVEIKWRLEDHLKLAGFMLLLITMAITIIYFGNIRLGARAKAETVSSEFPLPAKIPEKTATQIDFTIPLTPISNPSSDFSSLEGKKVLIFYFSPTCSHCQEAIPRIQALADEIRGQGYEAVAIAVQRNTKMEIQEFITRFRCRLPVFWDGERKFGDTYKTTVLPTLFLVKPSGDFFRIDGFSGEPSMDQLRQNL